VRRAEEEDRRSETANAEDNKGNLREEKQARAVKQRMTNDRKGGGSLDEAAHTEVTPISRSEGARHKLQS
jgi:hypothetical protein